MRTQGSLFALAVLLLIGAGCQAREPETRNTPPEGGAAPAGENAPAPAEPAAATAPAGEVTPAPSAAPAAAIASQESNWPGILVDVTEFRRKGSTLTARVVLRNQGTEEPQPEILYEEVYLMDLGAGKKYEVLKDENGSYIAALRQGWKDRWYDKLAPGKSYTLWMKFPAPSPDVKAVTLHIPGLPPFEDLPIQDA
jgi:hypothetical protein